MQGVLLSQADEMIHNLIEAEHMGVIKITEIGMEDSGYDIEDNKRHLSITIEYTPGGLDG